MTGRRGAAAARSPDPGLPVHTPPGRETLELLEVLADPVLLVAADRRLLAANRAARTLFPGARLGADLALAVRHPDVLRAVGGGRATAEIRLEQAAPVRRIFTLALTRQGDRHILIFRDITADARAADIRADLVANVSHELRSPLSALMGMIETLRGPARDDPAARARFLGIMADETTRMARLVEDLLSLARIETDEHVPPRDRVDLAQVVAAALDCLSASTAGQNRIVVRDLPANMPPVAGDAAQLRQVLQNLIDNALTHGRPGTEVTVRLFRIDRLRDSGQPGVAASIRDQGEGFDPEHIPRLTERFYRVDKGRARAMGGTGLGLAIVKHIVSRHRGQLDIETTPGHGSCFTVAFPLAQIRCPGPVSGLSPVSGRT